jgi:hypothetical protein
MGEQAKTLQIRSIRDSAGSGTREYYRLAFQRRIGWFRGPEAFRGKFKTEHAGEVRGSDDPRRRAPVQLQKDASLVQKVTVVGSAVDLGKPLARQVLQQHGAISDVRFAREQLVNACARKTEEQVLAGADDSE